MRCPVIGSEATVEITSPDSRLSAVWPIAHEMLARTHVSLGDRDKTEFGVQLLVNSEECTAIECRPVILPSGRQLLKVVAVFPDTPDAPEITRYAILLIERFQRHDVVKWRLPAHARVVLLTTAEDDGFEYFARRSDPHLLSLLGMS